MSIVTNRISQRVIFGLERFLLNLI